MIGGGLRGSGTLGAKAAGLFGVVWAVMADPGELEFLVLSFNTTLCESGLCLKVFVTLGF